MFVNRGDNGDEHDNNAIITEILQLRAERAKLLGYPTHAHWRLENAMAKTPERAMELMEAVWKPAVARVHEEVADMQALADKEGAKIKIEPWDYRYYAEKVRKARTISTRTKSSRTCSSRSCAKACSGSPASSSTSTSRRRRTFRSFTPTCASGK